LTENTKPVIMKIPQAGRVTAAGQTAEESPHSTGQDAG